MKAAYKQDIGKKRKNNEDSIFVDENSGIFLLADGMGGHQAGEVASELAVNEAYTCLMVRVEQVKHEKDMDKLLAESLLKTHESVREKSKTDLNLMGMGTTLVEMVIRDGRAYICHVGDSRAYILRKGIKQITMDQTVGDYLIEHKIMKEEEVPPQKWHTLTQAVGTSEEIVPELKHEELKIGDILLLCSDGLTDMLKDKEIEKIIKRHRDNIDEAVNALVDEANNKGGRDNISVVLVSYE